MILQLEQVSKSFGGRTLFDGASLRLEAYDHLALVGPNGAGKTTMLRIISGEEDADSGRVVLAKDARIGYLEQEAIEMGENPVFEEVLSSQVEILEAERRLKRDFAGYEVYYYDMNSGEELSPQQMLERIVLTEEEFLDGVRTAATARFEDQYSSISESDRETYGYYELLAYQKSDELINLELDKFYWDDGGNLGVFVPIASYAGAAWYYQLLYPTFRMG